MKHRLIASAVAVALASSTLAQVEFLDESFDFDRDHPAAGHWLGNARVSPAVNGWAALLLERDVHGAWSATITFLNAGALGTACENLEIDGSSVAFSIPTPAGAAFDGEVSEDGQRLSGTVALAGDDVGGEFELARTPRPMDLARPVAYTGILEIPQMGGLGMTFVLARTPGGNLVGHADVPAQALMGFPLVNVVREGQTITATLPATVPATLTADLDEDERGLTGTFSQGPFNLDVAFRRDDTYAGPALSRPQHPEPPYPYQVREVEIQHPEGHVLAGTLTIPPGDGPFPAAVMITGSGSQDRDEQIFGHRPFLVIADFLTRHGIAVLRHDDRGNGRSTGTAQDATTADFATDTMAAVEYLAAVPEVDPTRIGLIGHSEGGVIAPMVAGLSDRIAYLVLLAGTGVPGDEILRLQGRLALEAAGTDEQTIASLQEQQEKAFELLRAETDYEELARVMRPIVETQLAAATGLEGEELDDVVEVQLEQMASPWLRFFVTYDPRPALRKVRCPVLALNGTLDLQVWHDQNLPEIEKALTAAGVDFTIKRYENLNHLFQPAVTGSIMEYAVIETTFEEEVLEDIAEWILAKAGR